ncbi:MAG: lysostaphin resistance A-like protein [Candidatus Poribacteria bacterium]
MGKFIYPVIVITLSIWVYNDAKLNFRNGLLWSIGVLIGGFLFFPILFPIYFWIHPPFLFWDCPNCRRRNLTRFRECSRCHTVLAESEMEQRLRGYWGISDAISILLIAQFVSLLVILLSTDLSAGQANLSSKEVIDSLNPSVLWVAELISSNALIGLCLYCVTGRYRLPLTALGFTSNNLIRNIIFAILMTILLLVAEQVIINLIMYIGKFFSTVDIEKLIQQEAQQQLKIIPTSASDPLMILAVFVLLVLVPVSEEMLFRGIAYVAIRDRLGKTWGLLLSAILFASLHGLVFHFVPVLLLGLGLAYIYERTHSLIPCIVVHFLINVAAMISNF